LRTKQKTQDNSQYESKIRSLESSQNLTYTACL